MHIQLSIPRPLIGVTLSMGLITWLGASAPIAAEEIRYRFERMWPGLEQPWYFHNPIDVAVGPDGRVFIADNLNHRIQVFAADGAFVRTWGRYGSEPGMLNSPSGIALDGARRVFVADSDNHRVQVFKADGTFLREWGSEGSGPGEFNVPAGIAIDGAGWVYVADTYNHRIQVFTADGGFVREWGNEGSGPGEFDRPWYLTVDGTGRVYVADTLNHRIQVFETDGTFVRALGHYGGEPGEFDGPWGLALDGAGRVYVADTGNYRMQVFEADGAFLQAWGSAGSGLGTFDIHRGIALDGAGRVYVADSWNERIQVFAADGAFVQAWGSQGDGPGELFRPSSLTVDDAGRAYVADWGNDRIQVFESDGSFVREWGHYGSGLGELNYPFSMALDATGRVYVADQLNDRIQVFAADGTFVRAWGSEGSQPGQLDDPSGVAIDATGQVYVTDTLNHRIQVFAADGTFVRTWGSGGSGSGEFSGPSGLILDRAGRVYVADTHNDRIQVFTADGTFVREWGTTGSGPGELMGPIGITLDDAGRVYVTDTHNGRIQVFAADGTFLGMVGHWGSGEGQFNYPSGIAFDTRGNLYVADTANHRIQKLRPVEIGVRQHKAILVAGGGPRLGGTDNAIWDGTEILAKQAMKALGAQGIVKSQGQIRYLTAGSTNQDLDNNGQLDDLLPATPEVLRESLTGWAADAESLVLYLIGHGRQGAFLLNAEPDYQWLAAETLADWLAALQAQIPGAITVVIDACHAGSFIAQLAADRRVVLASSGPDELAQIQRDGTSFSRYFWNRIKSGSDLGNAFATASIGIADFNQTTYPQTPQADADGDGTATAFDLEALALRCLGACTAYGSEVPPTLNGPLASQVGEALTSLRLQVEAQEGAAPVQEVTATILPPDQFFADDPATGLPSPVTGLPEVALAYNAGTGLYEGIYDAFEQFGDYLISFRAQDADYTLSLPETTLLTQDQPPNLCSAQAEGWVQMAYVGYYGRPADPAGLDYWACRMDDEGGQLASIIEAFGTSNEYDQRFGGLDDATRINNIYQNLFNRDADQAGLDWYLGQLASDSMSLNSIALDVLNGALDLDEAIVTNKLAVADHFTRQVRNGCGYSDADIDAAVGLLGGVDAYQLAVAQGQQGVADFCGQ